MKTIQNAGLMAILGCLLLCLTACEEPSKEIDPKLNDQILVSGAIDASDVSVYINERGETNMIESFLNGNGVMNGNRLIFENGSINLMGRHSHITYRESMDNVQFEGGEFRYDYGNGNTLFGYYTGCGTYCPDNVCCNLNFHIAGGTGFFSNARGNFTAALGKNGSVDSPGLLMDLSGAIWVPKDNSK